MRDRRSGAPIGTLVLLVAGMLGMSIVAACDEGLTIPETVERAAHVVGVILLDPRDRQTEIGRFPADADEFHRFGVPLYTDTLTLVEQVTDTVLVTDTVRVTTASVTRRYCWVAQDGHDLPPYVVCSGSLPAGWVGLSVKEAP